MVKFETNLQMYTENFADITKAFKQPIILYNLSELLTKFQRSVVLFLTLVNVFQTYYALYTNRLLSLEMLATSTYISKFISQFPVIIIIIIM